MKRKVLPLRLFLWAGLIMLTTSVLAVGVNSLSYGFRLDYTISRYVGLETWSAIVFCLGNFVVAFFCWKFFRWAQESSGLPRNLVWLLGLVLVVGLVGLSVCPMGYFDAPGAAYGSSWPSFVHNRSARIMFCCMLLMMIVFLVWGRIGRLSRVLGMTYIIYGVIYVILYLMKSQWFAEYILIFESCFIFGFFGVSLRCGRDLAQDGSSVTGNKRVVKEENAKD